MHESAKVVAGSARERLFDAAALVFARHGLEGATTRQIAHEAGVNEVTLFRLFQNKENLQNAVLRRVIDQQAEIAAAQPPTSASADLRTELRQILRNYSATLQQNISLIRTIIGELHRHREHENQMLSTIFDPFKAELLRVLEAARQAGTIRADIDPQVVGRILPSVILTDTLRRTGDACRQPVHSAEEVLDMCLDVFIRGVAA